MLTLTEICIQTQEVKRSRFQASAGPVADEQAAKDFILQHSVIDASHNCWAWRIGQSYRFSDDGEPSGTAGRPILQAIDGAALDMVAVVVTRWFGGTLLGGGGLVRAYGGTASLCLQAAVKVETVPLVQVVLAVQFPDLALVKARLLAVPHLRLGTESFTETGAELHLSVPEEAANDIIRRVMDITSGRAVIGQLSDRTINQ